MYDLLVFIGRFQPFHSEHRRIIEIALQKARKVLVLVGSSGKAPTVRNPFSFEERQYMIERSFDSGMRHNLIIQPLRDVTYNDVAWIKQVQRQVNEVVLETVNNGGFRACGIRDAKVGLIGMNKDHTSYYLKMFPQFESVAVEQIIDLSSTDIRQQLFATSVIPQGLPDGTKLFLKHFVATDLFKSLKDEYTFVTTYKQQWKSAPYPVKHVTVDAVVVQSGHILLVKRRSEPGKGLLALPGGHLNPDERIVDGMIRELREETKIKVPEAVLRGSIQSSNVFDDPHRSTLGRVITHAFLVQLTDQDQLPKVKGSDDAEKAMWVPLADLQENQLFDDHFAIINFFLKLEASD